MKKLVIGFIGDHNVGKTTAADILRKKGFYKASINAKVEEFSKYLFPNGELNNNKETILNSVRRRGAKISKEYWLNLILVTVPDDKNLIVFDDLSIDELEANRIKVYQIYRPEVSGIRLPDIETIENDGSLENFIEKINHLHKKIAK